MSMIESANPGDSGCLQNRYLQVAGSLSSERLVFAIGHGGTGASVWLDVKISGDAGIGLFAIRLPGRESRLTEPLLQSVEALGADVATTVATIAEGRTVALAGVCFGAVVAYEASRQLTSHGIYPSRLIVIDSLFGPPKVTLGAIARDDDFRRYSRDKGLLPEWVWEDPELGAMLVQQLRADIAAHEGYLWPAMASPVANEVVVVTGHRVSSAEAKAWATAGEHFTVLDGSIDWGAELVQSPEQFGARLSAVFDSGPGQCVLTPCG